MSVSERVDGAGVSILVPCMNEASTIVAGLRGIAEVLPRAEIVVMHGGTDHTLELAETLRPEIPGLVLRKNKDDRGKGHAVKAAIQVASREVVAQFDADLQFYPRDLVTILDPVLQGRADVCVGSRFLPQSNASADAAVMTRDMGNRLLSAYASLLAGHRFSDVTTGMKAWTRAAMKQIDFRDDRYSYEVELLVRAVRLGLRVVDVPVQYQGRKSGVSMHRNSLAVAKAGTVILLKTTACRFRR